MKLKFKTYLLCLPFYMAILRYTLLMVGIVLLTNCNKDEQILKPGQVEYDPSGMIGLAVSPWPCDGHDSRRTSKSPNLGPFSANATLLYDEDSGASHWVSYAISSAIDQHGNLFSSTWGGIVKLTNTLILEKGFDAQGTVRNIPAIDKDGTIYIGVQHNQQAGSNTLTSGSLVALDQKLGVKWSFIFPNKTHGGAWGAVAIGSNGTIYVTCKADGLFAINKQGQKLWQYRLSTTNYSSPAIAPDGTIFVTDKENVYAINPTGKLKWKYPAGKQVNSEPVAGIDGSVYSVTSNTLLALKPNGELDWEFLLPAEATTRPSLADETTLLIACNNNHIYAINSNGTERWSLDVQGIVYNSIVIDRNGNMYFPGIFNDESQVRAITANREPLWQYPLNVSYYSQVVIGNDGQLIIGTRGAKLYLITNI